jgi:hypothetical protein
MYRAFINSRSGRSGIQYGAQAVSAFSGSRFQRFRHRFLATFRERLNPLLTDAMSAMAATLALPFHRSIDRTRITFKQEPLGQHRKFPTIAALEIRNHIQLMAVTQPANIRRTN